MAIINKTKIYTVKVITHAKKNEVKKEKNYLRVKVTASPVNGRANAVVIRLLAKFFDIKSSKVKIVKGLKSKQKTLEINI